MFQRGRNCEWLHLNNADIISMPDKWEYHRSAAGDLVFLERGFQTTKNERRNLAKTFIRALSRLAAGFGLYAHT
jgi:hypothetical protein